ncbi:MAG: lysophospholipid acyltransferase family protein [Gemmatimonadota bacterium]
MIRTLGVALAAGISMLVVGGIAILGAYVGFPRGYYDWAARTWSRIILWTSGIRVRVLGLEHIRRDGPQVIAANHQSMYDVYILATRIPVRYHFVAKRELRRIPVFGRAAAAAGHVFIDRADRSSAIESLRRAGAKMHEARSSAVVFPEGTRSRTGELQPLKKGPFRMALEAGVPIVPTVLDGTFDILPKGGRRIRPREVTIWFGDPVDPTAYGYVNRDALIAEVHGRMKTMLDTLRGRARVDSPTGAE